MAATIIPADSAPRRFDRVDGTLHVESVGDDSSHPRAVYGLTIVHFGTWRDVAVQPGHSNHYPAVSYGLTPSLEEKYGSTASDSGLTSPLIPVRPLPYSGLTSSADRPH